MLRLEGSGQSSLVEDLPSDLALRLSCIEYKLDVLLGNSWLWGETWSQCADEQALAEEVGGVTATALSAQCMAVRTIQKRWRIYMSRRKSMCSPTESPSDLSVQGVAEVDLTASCASTLWCDKDEKHAEDLDGCLNVGKVESDTQLHSKSSMC
eukprot:5425458-Karenia_brevis.AAC.1